MGLDLQRCMWIKSSVPDPNQTPIAEWNRTTMTCCSGSVSACKVWQFPRSDPYLLRSMLHIYGNGMQMGECCYQWRKTTQSMPMGHSESSDRLRGRSGPPSTENYYLEGPVNPPLITEPEYMVSLWLKHLARVYLGLYVMGTVSPLIPWFHNILTQM